MCRRCIHLFLCRHIAPMHEVVPKVVAMAVKMVMTKCSILGEGQITRFFRTSFQQYVTEIVLWLMLSLVVWMTRKLWQLFIIVLAKGYGNNKQRKIRVICV